MIFIDGSNLYHSSKAFKLNYRVDYVKLIEKLDGNRDLIRTYFYGSTKVPPIPEQTSFHSKLEYMGIKTTIKPLKYGKEKGIDVALVTDLLILAYGKTMDIAVIVSGDQDFVDAIKEVQRQGIIVEVASFPNGFSDPIKRTADKIIPLESMATEIQHTST